MFTRNEDVLLRELSPYHDDLGVRLHSTKPDSFNTARGVHTAQMQVRLGEYEQRIGCQ